MDSGRGKHPSSCEPRASLLLISALGLFGTACADGEGTSSAIPGASVAAGGTPTETADGADASDASPAVADGGSSTAGWFPFAFQGLDATPTPTDLSALNPTPAGAAGRIRVQDGHFVDPSGQRVRFFGFGLAADACFPSKDQAALIAAHFRKLGVNILRLHQMDFGTPPHGLVLPDRVSLDVAQLDRLDYFVARLKESGIYSNLTLHVDRYYPGMPDKGATELAFEFGKEIDRFYPAFLQYQKDYARDLLTHRNPYTGLTYAQDPAVAVVEIANEDTLFPFWGGNPWDMGEPYRAELARQWRAWLGAKYASTELLAQAWQQGLSPLGAELLKSASLATPTPVTGWQNWASYNGGAATLTVLEDGGTVLRWNATTLGSTSWAIQIGQNHLPLSDGTGYTLAFRARLSPGQSLSPATLNLNLQADGGTYPAVGLERQVEITDAWQDYRYTFQVSGVGAWPGVLSLSHDQLISVDLADWSLRSGVDGGLPPGQTLEDGNIALPPEGGGVGGEREDFGQFLADTENAGVLDLQDYLRRELGVEALVVDTQADYGGEYGLRREATMSDAIDLHGYWDHPAFPADWWSTTQWTIENRSQVADRQGGVLGTMGAYRVAGMPFSVSEYNVSAPNDAAAETLPLFSTIAALQDWDAIYVYDYLNFSVDYAADHILGFFDVAGHAGRLAFVPAAALAFRQGLVRSGLTPITLTVPEARRGRSWESAALPILWSALGTPVAAIGRRRLEVRLVAGDGAPSISEVLPASPSFSDTGEIAWQSDLDQPRFTVNAPALRLAVGQLAGHAVALGDVTLEIGAMAGGFACVELVALDELPLAESKSVLLGVAGRVENQGMVWNAARTSVSDRWGTAPALAEPVPLKATLPGSGWRVSSLDGKGAVKAEVRVTASDANTLVDLSEADRSLWYLLER